MLRLVQLRKSFGKLVAVDSLTLQIERGEVFGLLGPNGAGKSTTIGMAVGLIHPDSGTVNLDGLGAPTKPAVRRHLGVAPQSLALYDDLTGRENLQFFASLYSLSPRDKRERVEKVLGMVGLSARKGDRVKTYSGGMKRRLNLAVALIHDPPILLLDEPTANVDPHSRNNILDLVRELAGAGRTIIYTTHYMEEAARLCSRVGVIDQGRLLAMGTVSELVAKYGGHTLVTIQRPSGEERIETSDPLRVIARVMNEPAGHAAARRREAGVEFVAGALPTSQNVRLQAGLPMPAQQVLTSIDEEPGGPPHRGGARSASSVLEQSHLRPAEAPESEALALLEGDAVSGVRIDRPDLESVFLTLTGRSLRD